MGGLIISATSSFALVTFNGTIWKSIINTDAVCSGGIPKSYLSEGVDMYDNFETDAAAGLPFTSTSRSLKFPHHPTRLHPPLLLPTIPRMLVCGVVQRSYDDNEPQPAWVLAITVDHAASKISGRQLMDASLHHG